MIEIAPVGDRSRRAAPNTDCSTVTSMQVAAGGNRDADDPSFSLALTQARDRAVVALGSPVAGELALRLFDVSGTTAVELGTPVMIPGVKRYFQKVIRLSSGTFRVFFTTATTPTDLVYRDYNIVGTQLVATGTTTPFGGATSDLQDVDYVMTVGGSLGASNAGFSERAP